MNYILNLLYNRYFDLSKKNNCFPDKKENFISLFKINGQFDYEKINRFRCDFNFSMYEDEAFYLLNIFIEYQKRTLMFGLDFDDYILACQTEEFWKLLIELKVVSLHDFKNFLFLSKKDSCEDLIEKSKKLKSKKNLIRDFGSDEIMLRQDFVDYRINELTKEQWGIIWFSIFTFGIATIAILNDKELQDCVQTLSPIIMNKIMDGNFDITEDVKILISKLPLIPSLLILFDMSKLAPLFSKFIKKGDLILNNDPNDVHPFLHGIRKLKK